MPRAGCKTFAGVRAPHGSGVPNNSGYSQRMLRPLLLIAAAASAACAGGRSDGSAGIARALARATTDDDARAAYTLLSRKVQQRVSFDEWTRRWKETRGERARQSTALEVAVKGGATLGERARLHVDESEVTSLVREGDGWRLETPLLVAGGAPTPEEALRRFADALDERSFGAVLRLLTAERQAHVRQAVDGFAGGLREHAAELVETTPDRATLVWTDGNKRWRVVLVREQGSWRIEDFSRE